MSHLYFDQYLWIETQTKEKTNVPAEFNDWFGFGTAPKDFTTDTPSYEELKITNQIENIREQFGNILEVEYAPTDMGMNTIKQVLIRTIFHEGTHFQNIVNLKKFIK